MATPHRQSEQAPARQSRGVMLTTMVLGILILIPSMAGFVNKFYEFFHATQESTDGVYVLTPMVNYLLASGGFFCFLLWSTAQGMFHDIEAPKRTMLEQESTLDIDENVSAPHWAGGAAD